MVIMGSLNQNESLFSSRFYANHLYIGILTLYFAQA